MHVTLNSGYGTENYRKQPHRFGTKKILILNKIKYFITIQVYLEYAEYLHRGFLAQAFALVVEGVFVLYKTKPNYVKAIMTIICTVHTSISS